MRIGVRVGDVGREIDRCDHRLQFQVDARLLARLLENLLGLLPRLVDRRLEDVFQRLAVLGPDPIRTRLPTRLVQHRDRFLDAELVVHVGRIIRFRHVDEVRRRDAPAAVDVFLHRVTLEQVVERLAHRRVGQRRMLGLHARPLPVHLDVRVGEIALDECSIPGSRWNRHARCRRSPAASGPRLPPAGSRHSRTRRSAAPPARPTPHRRRPSSGYCRNTACSLRGNPC